MKGINAPQAPSRTSRRPLATPRVRGTRSIPFMRITSNHNGGLMRTATTPGCGGYSLGSVPDMPALGEPDATPGGGLRRRLTGRNPPGDRMRGHRGHQDPGAEVPRGQPGVLEPGNPVDDRPSIRVAGPETAPLIVGLEPAHGRQRSVQRLQDGVDDVLPHRRRLVTGVEGAADQEPAVVELGGHRRHRAGEAYR